MVAPVAQLRESISGQDLPREAIHTCLSLRSHLTGERRVLWNGLQNALWCSGWLWGPAPQERQGGTISALPSTTA